MRYEIDPYNRLVFSKTGKKRGLPKFRQVLDGRFKVNKKNNLSYHIKTPLLDTDKIPHQIKLKGEWSLTDDHNLRLTLDKSGRETFGDQVILRGKILDVNANSLLFAIKTKTKRNERSTYILDLGGSWKADRNNRLSFHIKKEKSRHNILTFNGIWEINKTHQIVYKYEKAELIRKKKQVRTLIFKGYWDIKDKFRVSYVLDKNTNSVFNFETSAGIFKKNYIKYRLGIRLTDRVKPIRQTVTLFGKWKMKRNTGLIFEIRYKDKKAHAIIFGAEARLTGKDTISFKLKNDIENKDIGVVLKLSHKISKGDGEAFLRFLRSKQESVIYAGMAGKW